MQIFSKTKPPESAAPKGLGTVLKSLIDQAASMQRALELIAARSIAHETVMNALIATHPEPRRLFDAYSTQVDTLSTVESVASNAAFQQELHAFQTQILRAVNTGVADRER